MKNQKYQNWVVGDEPENCIPIGTDTASERGGIVRARSAEEACKKGIALYNKTINPKSVRAKI